MEIKFNETPCNCLRRAVNQLQTKELTHEVRLPDPMPDIGRVLGCWGQPVVRGKEWRDGTMGISGGVQAWVLYQPEDQGEVMSLEVWIPYQIKWDLPHMEKDGKIWVCPRIKSMDARTTSARKIMIRCDVSAWGQAWEDVRLSVYDPSNVPEDVQLLTATYPMELPLETGEKQITLEEELTLPEAYPAAEKLLRYELILQNQDQKMMASRLVFRGKALLHVLYMGGGALRVWEKEIPISQFADLEAEYSPNADARISPVLTDLELVLEDGKLLLKAGITAQYVIYDRVSVSLAEDAYSPIREVKGHLTELKLPQRLDASVKALQIQQNMKAEMSQIVDVCWMPDHPKHQQLGEMGELDLPGQFQVLYRDHDDQLHGTVIRYDQQVQMATAAGVMLEGAILPEGFPVAMLHGDGAELTVDMHLEMAAFGGEGLNMLTGLELGAVHEADPHRPSLILCRGGGCSLWDLAKSCGSTMEAIRLANGLEAEPEKDRMLLIPVL